MTKPQPEGASIGVDRADALARLNRSLDFGMTIVTAAGFGEKSGCLVGFQGQVSIDPLLWGVWISSVNHSYPIVSAADTIAVHFLDHTQHALAHHFGALTGDETDKFDGIELDDDPDPADLPLISACRRRIIGRRVDVLYGPTDHSCVVIEPHTISCPATFRPLRIGDVGDVAPGHPLRSQR